jgi:hypothetical protein
MTAMGVGVGRTTIATAMMAVESATQETVSVTMVRGTSTADVHHLDGHVALSLRSAVGLIIENRVVDSLIRLRTTR